MPNSPARHSLLEAMAISVSELLVRGSMVYCVVLSPGLLEGGGLRGVECKRSLYHPAMSDATIHKSHTRDNRQSVLRT